MTAQLLVLRPYQREIYDAILASIDGRRGDSFSVEIARQGGKNEISAFIELQVLFNNLDRNITSIKLAPTQRPQANMSLDRLWDRIRDLGLGAYASKEGGNAVRLGRARQLFLSADKQSNVVGHTADLLLEIDEAQDVDVDKFDKELQPMARPTAPRPCSTAQPGTTPTCWSAASNATSSWSAETAADATSSSTGAPSRPATRRTRTG